MRQKKCLNELFKYFNYLNWSILKMFEVSLLPFWLFLFQNYFVNTPTRGFEERKRKLARDKHDVIIHRNQLSFFLLNQLISLSVNIFVFLSFSRRVYTTTSAECRLFSHKETGIIITYTVYRLKLSLISGINGCVDLQNVTSVCLLLDFLRHQLYVTVDPVKIILKWKLITIKIKFCLVVHLFNFILMYIKFVNMGLSINVFFLLWVGKPCVGLEHGGGG